MIFKIFPILCCSDFFSQASHPSWPQRRHTSGETYPGRLWWWWQPWQQPREGGPAHSVSPLHREGTKTFPFCTAGTQALCCTHTFSPEIQYWTSKTLSRCFLLTKTPALRVLENAPISKIDKNKKFCTVLGTTSTSSQSSKGRTHPLPKAAKHRLCTPQPCPGLCWEGLH